MMPLQISPGTSPPSPPPRRTSSLPLHRPHRTGALPVTSPSTRPRLPLPLEPPPHPYASRRRSHGRGPTFAAVAAAGIILLVPPRATNTSCGTTAGTTLRRVTDLSLPGAPSRVLVRHHQQPNDRLETILSSSSQEIVRLLFLLD